VSPPGGPADIAGARRDADRKALARAQEAGDWAEAFDIMLANIHEVESIALRSLARHEVTLAEIKGLGKLIEALMGRVGELAIAVESDTIPAAPPSYRPDRNSASNLDAQALGQTIENVDRKHSTDLMALGAVVERLQAQVGEAPDVTKGRKGSGISEIVHRLDSKETIAKLAILAALASAAGTQVADLVKFVIHLKG
jgi:hypothetical protein